ncbi:MAG: flippase [Candidatus Zixiibacteriota bacterium]
MSAQRKIAKNAFHNFLVKTIALTFGFIASVVVARFLGPEKYGVYSFVIWFLTMVGLLAHLGIPTTVTKYVSEYWGRKDFSAIGEIVHRLRRIEVFAGVVLSLVLFLLAPSISQWYNNPDLSLYLRVAALVILPLTLMFFYNGLFCGLQRFDLIAKINLVVSPVTVALFLLIVYFGGTIEWLVSVSAVTNVFLVACYVYYRRREFAIIQKGASPSDLGGKLLKFSATAFVVLLLDAIIWERFGIFFLSIYSTPSEIAFYNVAFIFSSRTMILLPGALTGILLPAMSEVYGGGDRQELARVHSNSTRYLAMLSFPLCLGGIAIAGQLFQVLYGSSYQPASLVFVVLLLGGTVGSIGTSSYMLLYAQERQNVVLRVGVVSALVSILASWLLVPLLGSKGAALAVGLSQSLGGVLLITYAYRRSMKQPFPGRSLLRVFCAAALMGCVAFLLSESIKGPVGLALALVCALPLYIFSLFLFRSVTSGDVHLLQAALQRLPGTWGRMAQGAMGWLIKLFYPSI